MTRRGITQILTVFIAAGLTTVCGGDAVEPPTPTTISVSPASVTLRALGETAQLAATVQDQNGEPMSGATASWITWATSDPSVATVDASGLVTAVDNGAATVTATAGSASGTAAVTVAQEVGAVTVSPAADTVLLADTVRLSASAVDANGHSVSTAEFTWASDDVLVATVDGEGLVTGTAVGEVEITATSGGVTGRARLTVAVPAPAAVVVTPDTVTLTAIGHTARLAAEVRDQAGRAIADVQVSWSSADTRVARVNSAGLVAAAGGGSTTIVATAGAASGEATVMVVQSADSVVVSPSADTISPGDTLRLEAKAFDENGHGIQDAEFAWSSSAAWVLQVDASGRVKGLAEGRATVTAVAGDARGTSAITVENLDRAALVALYEATDGPNWVNNDNWLTDAPLGDWYGVDTGDYGRVVRLDLRGTWDSDFGRWVGHGLHGAIPPELANLTNLKVLHLHANSLTGSIPTEFGNLRNLYELNLESNNLTGPIPSELGNLSNLTELWLNWNNLTGPIPSKLGNLRNLRSLVLDNNGLTGPIPPELGNLSSLRGLYLNSNGLTGPIPSELGNLSSLRSLRLSSNNLTGTIPSELGDLPILDYLNLGNNNLTGTIPSELGNLSSLRTLDLYSNGLTGPIPSELRNLSSLRTLYLNYNKLTGSIPLALGSIPNLERLSLDSNGLTGPIPKELGNLSNLERLRLQDNGLTGTVPPELGNLSDLEQLRLSENSLTGAIPTSFLGLSLSDFVWNRNAGLCAPNTAAFRAWLNSIQYHYPGPFCSGSGGAAGSAIPWP